MTWDELKCLKWARKDEYKIGKQREVTRVDTLQTVTFDSSSLYGWTEWALPPFLLHARLSWSPLCLIRKIVDVENEAIKDTEMDSTQCDCVWTS